ncbi:hypothetical protein AGOR_G00007010 [Albula goreensis]|uniref:Uncharacterized protein n=1 Tax=Albula goreensis TaxID=1534307 RepID=A0A8T3E5M3_9TELE|nr:hypothetical protein AGOR_G00007010 [Albula goreensis]
MSVGASSAALSNTKGTFSTLLAARVGKRPEHVSEQELQEVAVQLLNRNQNLQELLQEVSPPPYKVIGHGKEGLKDEPGKDNTHEAPPRPEAEAPPTLGSSLLLSALQREAERLGVPVGVLSARLVAERVRSVLQHNESILLNPTQRAQLAELLQSTQELLSLGAFSPQLFCQELWNGQMQPQLEVIWSLHSGNILSWRIFLTVRWGQAHGWG